MGINRPTLDQRNKVQGMAMAEVRRRRVLEEEGCKFKHLVSVLSPNEQMLW